MLQSEAAQGPLRVRVRRRGAEAELLFSGELDMSTVALLSRAVREVVAAGSTLLVVNLSAVSFCDAAGVGALIESSSWVRTQGGSLELEQVAARPLRVLEICQVLDLLHVRGLEPGTSEPTSA